MNRMKHLEQLGTQFHISIPTDEGGFVGRECHQADCQGYFKIKPGTGIKGEVPCHCPYCGHTGDQSEFWTNEQREYALSIVKNKFQDALHKDFAEWDRELQRKYRNSFIKLRMDFKGQNHSIRFYREERLETQIMCDQCTLEYAIYGVFAYCPDCGVHNSLQILNKNLELAEREIALASTVEQELATYLVGDALENAVAAFDGFGRETCRVHSQTSSNPDKALSVSFQNLIGARQRIQELFGVDMVGETAMQEWELANRCFQKRHLLAHKMGVVDEAYLDATGDTNGVVGHRVSITPEEVTCLIMVLRKIGKSLVCQISNQER